MKKSSSWWVAGILLVLLVALVVFLVYMLQLVRQTTAQALSPVMNANAVLGTQVSGLLHPTPTIIPDPVTIVNEVRSLARLETIQYSIEKVITAETGQGSFGFLFGDKLLVRAAELGAQSVRCPRDSHCRSGSQPAYFTRPQAGRQGINRTDA